MTDENVNSTPTPGDLPEAETANSANEGSPSAGAPENEYSVRLERLGGEPAPAITPEEFARLQKAGQVHIDARGRVHAARRSDAEAGVSLKKRRAWYTPARQ
ncbi:MAG: hypothetical protein KME04_15380 [Pleurocapsa minor GSE-CHR-MK-17-07R]|jgi:hypothetical protein|nr:hypothetical protein [Pleurocapsa minor GSE-CHR-MK 17-07R]